MSNNKQGFPGLDRITDQPLQFALRALWDQVAHLRGRGGKTISFEGPLDAGGFKVTNVSEPTSDSDVVTKGYADATYGAQQVKLALQMGGTNPLINPINTTGAGTALYDSHDNRLALSVYSAGTLADGTLMVETDRKALYQVQSVDGIPTWVLLHNLPFDCTLSPDTKPTDLGLNDEGFLINATDFDRMYVWGGTSWSDAPGHEATRGMIAMFDTSNHPGTLAGWALSDGNNAVFSLANGTTSTYPTVNMNGKMLRGTAGATGVTGGNDSVTSGAPSGTATVQAGTGATVADSTHTHTVATVSAYGAFGVYVRL